MPTISIVIPTFRRPHYLRETLASITTQSILTPRPPHSVLGGLDDPSSLTDVDIEVLVCDNGADEINRLLVSQLRDRRFVYVPRSRNVGMMRNAVAGFLQARGEFVLKLDDDDVLHPDALAMLYEPFCAHPGLTLTFGSFTLVDAAGRPLLTRTADNEAHSGRATLTPGRKQPFEALVACGAVNLACALVRHDAIDWAEIPDDVATAYDRYIALQAARDGAAAWFVGQSLTAYRIHDRSDSATAYTRQALGSLHAMERALAAGRHVHPQSLVDSTQGAALRAARGLLRENYDALDLSPAERSATARKLLWRAVRRRPDPALLRILALAVLPRILARPIARRRLASHQLRMEQAASQAPALAQLPARTPSRRRTQRLVRAQRPLE